MVVLLLAEAILTLAHTSELVKLAHSLTLIHPLPLALSLLTLLLIVRDCFEMKDWEGHSLSESSNNLLLSRLHRTPSASPAQDQARKATPYFPLCQNLDRS